MNIIVKHQIIPEQQGSKLILFLDQNATEFASEFGTNQAKQSTNLENSVQKYIDEMIPKNIIVKTVQIVVGTVILTTISLNGGHSISTTAEASTISSDQSTSYVVKAGDTLSGIAKLNQVSVDQLKQTNNLASDLIKVGQVLIIPKNFTTITPPAPVTNQTYSVVSGDNLSMIAKRFSITVDSLRSTNQLTSDIIRIGQILTIPSGASGQMTQSGTTNAPQPLTSTVSHRVVSGDSLWSISQQFGTTVDAIRMANHLTSDRIFVGQTLTILASGIAPIAPSQVLATSYTVKAGDSLSVIAKQFNTTVDAIKQSNQLSTDVIRIGQVLTITKDTTMTPPVPTINETSATEIQKSLQELGYYAVPTMTTNVDSGTIQAIKTFQSDYGLPVTGVGDATTQTAIDHALVKKGLIRDTTNYIGVPYVWGGESPNGFDCSGFVYFMFNQHGVGMGRTTSGNLFLKGIAIDRSKLQPGDLVFFSVNTPGVVSHVGFYVGNNQFVSATSSKGIQSVSLDNSYWSKYYMGAKRVY